MFKAISRWGSQVRSSLGIGFISNLFSSKSKKYGEFNDETEEIFSDAHEDIDTDNESEDDNTTVVIETLKPKTTFESENDGKDSNEKHILDDSEEPDGIAETDDNPKETQDSVNAIIQEVKDITTDAAVQSCDKCEQDSNVHGGESENSDSESSGSESVHNSEHDEDTHHDDTTKIVKTSSKANGMPQSNSSASLFKKVHRRVNSYTQRQYAKFDNAQDDENDNRITADDSVDADEIQVVQEDVSKSVTDKKTEKKTKKKKVPLFSFLRGIFRRTNK